MDKINTRVFLKVYEAGSFVAAAKELGYTQAGVSYIISMIERELGFPLFIREKSGIRLTYAGMQILPIIQSIDTYIRLLEEKRNDILGLKNGHVKVLVFDSISVHWIPGILEEYKHDFPGIIVELITEENSRKAEELVRTQQVDCGFFLHAPHDTALDITNLLEEKMMAVVSKSHPLATLDKFPMSELGNYPYIDMAYTEENGISDIFKSRSIKPQIVYQLDNDFAAMSMVSKNHGFCIFPELLLRDIPYELKTMEFSEPVSRTVSIATKSIITCSIATKMFIQYTENWVKRNSTM